MDAEDPGCLDFDDSDEADPEEVPLCANEQDDDEDGQVDWPADPSCRAAADPTEDAKCRPGVEVLDLEDRRVFGETERNGPDRYLSSCGGRGAPDAVVRYVLDARADLTFSLDNPGTRFPAALSVRRDCEHLDTEIACSVSTEEEGAKVTIRDAEPGLYLVIIDGGEIRVLSSGEAIDLGDDPREFEAAQDLREECGWNDGGNDAFDCYGRIRVAFDDEQIEVSPLRGENQYEVGGYRFRVRSDFAQQGVWRLRLEPVIPNDRRRVRVSLTGNVGSDGRTLAREFATERLALRFPYLYTTDGDAVDAPLQDPPIVHLWVPNDPDEIDDVEYDVDGDDVTITAPVRLPLVAYTAISYAPHAEVAAALVEDLALEAVGAATFGRFELTARAE